LYFRNMDHGCFAFCSPSAPAGLYGSMWILRLDVYPIQLDDPIRLHAWSLEDFLAFGNVVNAGQSVSARNRNNLLPKGVPRCWSSNKALSEILAGSAGELAALRNKVNIIDLYPHVGEMSLSAYWRDEDGFAPATILTPEGELLFRQWLQIPDADKKPEGPPRARPGLGALRVVQSEVEVTLQVKKRVLAQLTPQTKKRAATQLGIAFSDDDEEMA
jgi:hypothetical protein